MEKNLNKKVQEYQLSFKNDIKKWLEDTKTSIVTNNSVDNKTSDFLKFVFDYTSFELTKSDFQKRKRAKNIIPQQEKCIAKRANGVQCTRRRKQSDVLMCGTHLKGTPHGVCSEDDTHNTNDTNVNYAQKNILQTTKVEIWIQEIKGINYYIDNVNNVYRTEDIISNKQNPDIIAKWKLNGNDKYTIPEFGI
jgi:hypothetical protein